MIRSAFHTNLHPLKRNAVISVSMLFSTSHAIEVFQFASLYFYSVSNSI